jgi:protein TonB
VSDAPSDWREFQPVDVLPQEVREVKPPYPDLAREAGVEGRVLVHVLVGIDGHVLRAEADPHATVPMLEAAAVEAAREWVFTPALANGHPVKAWATIPFNFTLH